MNGHLADLPKSRFGYDRFRPPQREIMEAALANRDTLAILPTGAGKSLCYQLPALARDGLTLVVSPLISLEIFKQGKSVEEVAKERASSSRRSRAISRKPSSPATRSIRAGSTPRMRKPICAPHSRATTMSR